jgi:hypothetical protein
VGINLFYRVAAGHARPLPGVRGASDNDTDEDGGAAAGDGRATLGARPGGAGG